MDPVQTTLADEVREQVRRRRIDPQVEADTVRQLAIDVVAEHEKRSLTGAVRSLDEPDRIVGGIVADVAGFGPLQPFLDDVFPNAELTLDESFNIERFSRAGANEAFNTLSGGTQEQIAVLVRLAMGALLQERGEDAPIILDDALVFCDDDRIEQMFDALNRAAARQQVIVLTCRTRGFRTLGGRMLTIEPVAQGLR